MSDPNKDPTVKTAPQPQEVPKLEDFKGVLGWVEQKKEESKAKGESWGWVMGLIAAVVVFIALAYAAYVAWKKGREIAELKHKIDIDEEKRIQAESDAMLASLRKDIEKHHVAAVTLEHQITNTKAKIKQLEEERKALNSKIDKITCWEDVDSL